MKNTFTKNDLKACQVDLREWAGITMNLKQVAALLSIDTPSARFLAKDFAEAHPSPKWGMDTAPRDVLFGHVAKVFVGPKTDWPINGDGPNVGKKFFAKLAKAFDKKGIKHDF